LARDNDDRLAAAAPVDWAARRLHGVLTAKGAVVEFVEESDPTADLEVLIAGGSPGSAGQSQGILASVGLAAPAVAESFAIVPFGSDGRRRLLLAGHDERGLVYAILELADRVEHADDPIEALRFESPVAEQPRNAVRSVARCFASEIDDKPWLQSEAFWQDYLTMAVSQRFNRVNLMVGLGYNFPWHVTDAYLFFPYPFLLDVSGYRVRVPQLPDEERDRNLAMLQFASEQAAARGLDFQIGLWTHAYEWFESPDARHTVEGLTPDRHAEYCRDALAQLLDACPAITGLTVRTHGESGVAERSWDFWRTALDGVAKAGRPVGIDLHSKGLDRETLDIALATGQPITVSAKYSAEHQGLPYHQAAIRELDRPPVADYDERGTKARYMAVCEGSRPFTRYSYGDFLREGRPYDVVYRIWPGTQRVLLSGDPAMAAGLSRSAGIAGCQGLEWCEPLSLKGREGTGLLPGGRNGYADGTLSPVEDWHKHAYTYRVVGRRLYNPEATDGAWARSLTADFGASAPSAEAALANASRILPLVTSAHHPSASNNYYWPELYTDLAIVAGARAAETHYYDTPVPKRFGTVGPLDPEIFSSVQECIEEAEATPSTGRVSPWTVAERLDSLAAVVAEKAAEVREAAGVTESPAVRRLLVDVAILAALGRFFSSKLKAAVCYEIGTRTGSSGCLRDAVAALRAARSAWADAVIHADGVYVDDLTYGPQPWLRGSWSDRLAAIDADLDAMEAAAASGSATDREDAEAQRLLVAVTARPPHGGVTHTPPTQFRPGEPVSVAVGIDDDAPITGVSLRYRHLDQSATYEELLMQRDAGGFAAVVPAEYSDSPFALQYHFAIHGARGSWQYPELGAELSDQPYFVVRQRAEDRRRADGLPPPTKSL
jgi:hypothetical protein